MGSFADIDRKLADVPAEIVALLERVDRLEARIPAGASTPAAGDSATSFVLELGRGPLSVRSLLQLHRVLMAGSGESRAGLPTDALRGLQLTELVAQYELAVSRRRHPPLLLACALVLDFAVLAPFDSGNERMAQLLLMRELPRHGFEVARSVAMDWVPEDWDAARKASEHEVWPWVRYVLGVVAGSALPAR